MFVVIKSVGEMRAIVLITDIEEMVIEYINTRTDEGMRSGYRGGRIRYNWYCVTPDIQTFIEI